MKLILLFLLCIPIISFSQQWKDAKVPLKYPHSDEHAVGGIAWINRIDTAAIYYISYADTTVVLEGYKLVYCDRGYYTDNKRTLGVFFDINKNRIKNVKVYRWKA